MNLIIKNFENIKSLINNSNVNIVAVSKTFTFEDIKPLVDYGHIHFGENKVQEAAAKWVDIKRFGYEDERYTIFSRVLIQLPRISSLAIL